MSRTEVLDRTIGFTGPDGVGKTTFALLAIDMLRQKGQKVVFCPFPFLDGTLSGKLLRAMKDKPVTPIAVPPVFMANRLELLPALRDWIGRGEDHWVIFDRVKQDGPVFAQAVGRFPMEMSSKKEYAAWLHKIEALFPEVMMGFFMTRPLEESLEIMKSRMPAEGLKAKFDASVPIQRAVRKIFAKEFAHLSQWRTIEVEGLVSGREALKRWQQPYMENIWTMIVDRVGNNQWKKNTKRTIVSAQRRVMKANIDMAQAEITRTVQQLSRPSGVPDVRIWGPAQYS